MTNNVQIIFYEIDALFLQFAHLIKSNQYS